MGYVTATGNALRTVTFGNIGFAAAQALTPSADLAASSVEGVYLWLPSTGVVEETLFYPNATAWLSFTASGIVASAGSVTRDDVDNYAVHWCRNR